MKQRKLLLCLLAVAIVPAFANAKSKKGKGFDKFDSNGDEVITLEEAQAADAKKLIENFDEIDDDGNGEVTKEELRTHHKERRETHRVRRESLDTDNSGTISLEEAEAAGMEKLVENFDKIDANGDGEISRDEMKDKRKKKKNRKEDS